jgi:hypothetical protein
MGAVAKLDEFGKPAWIGLTILGFVVWWPLGLATLAFIIGSGRMGCGWRSNKRWQAEANRAGEQVKEWFKGRAPSSGNRAFDEYREETLRRLEEEEREFRAFLERLRLAKDKAEFDEFMAERRRRTETQVQA